MVRFAEILKIEVVPEPCSTCNSVPDAVFAVIACSEESIDRTKRINRYMDSQATIRALENPFTKPRMVQNYKENLNEPVQDNKVYLIMMPSHEEILSNKISVYLNKKDTIYTIWIKTVL